MYAQNTIENFLRGIVLDLIDSERRKTVVEAALYNWRQSAVKALEGQKGTSKNNNTQKVNSEGYERTFKSCHPRRNHAVFC